MSKAVIEIDGIGKKYAIGENQRYYALRDVLSQMLESPIRLLRNRSRPSRVRKMIWALQDISLSVQQGEVVGIIGRNGAGKSTLLKILSRITEPTIGEIRLRGRVGSLLEAGTGFHPELTGRENVFFNGALLGMKRVEIAGKFDEIVAFAEVEEFIDTPVKHYSSGMQMRLAFSVAAHLEPEILVVDEVLAVGDLAFQKKCLGKMGSVAEGGRTVLLVSHQLNQLRRLCGRCVWLDQGMVREVGQAGEVLGAYEAAVTSDVQGSNERVDGFNSLNTRFVGWEVLAPEGEGKNIIRTLGPVAIQIKLLATRDIRNAHHGISLFNGDNQLIWGTAHDRLQIEQGQHNLVYRLPSLPVRPSAYFWRVSLFDDAGLIDLYDFPTPLIVDTMPLGHRFDQWAGVLNIPVKFSMETANAVR